MVILTRVVSLESEKQNYDGSGLKRWSDRETGDGETEERGELTVCTELIARFFFPLFSFVLLIKKC